jgi:TP901 family phage tail tape measure protein
MAEGGAAGVSMKDMEGFLTVASKAAVAFDMNSREIGKYFGQIKAQTQWSNAEMEVFVDKVNALADAGATSEASIVQMFQRASESGKAAGVKLDTSLAALSALNSVGMDESSASTMWGQFTAKLATMGKGKSGEFKALGMDLAQFKKNFSKDSTSAIIDLLQHLQDFKGNKAEVLQSLFGKQWWDEVARAGNALPEILKNLNLINDPSKYKGGATNAFNLQMETTYAKMEQVKVLSEQVASALLGWTLDPIKAGLQGVLDAAKAIEKVINLFKGQGKAESGNFMQMAGEEGGKLWRDTTSAAKSKWQSAKDWWNGTKPQQQQPLPMMAQMQSVSPSVDVKGLDAAKAGLTDVKSGLDAVGSTSATPQVNASSIQAANEAAKSLLQTLQSIPGAAASAGSAAQAAASKVSSLRSLGATSFSAGGDAAGAR